MRPERNINVVFYQAEMTANSGTLDRELGGKAVLIALWPLTIMPFVGNCRPFADVLN